MATKPKERLTMVTTKETVGLIEKIEKYASEKGFYNLNRFLNSHFAKLTKNVK